MVITGESNTIAINPNSSSVFTVKRNSDNANLIYFNSDGSGKVGGWNIGQYDLTSQFRTQETVWETRDVLDENGNPIYKDVPVYDDEAKPVYETDEQGNVIYEETYKTDAEGNIIFEIVYDSDGNPLQEIVYDENGDEVHYIDEDGNNVVLTQNVTQPVIVQLPKQLVEKVKATYQVEVVTGVLYDNYTVLNTRATNGNSNDISLAIGVRPNANGELDINNGAIKLYNSGIVQGTKNIIYNGTAESQLFFNRDRNSLEQTSIMIYNADNDSATLAYAFKNKSDNNYTYTLFMNKNGIFPYHSGFSIGSTSYRWNMMYTSNLDVSNGTCIGNILKMRDDNNNTRNVIRLYHSGQSSSYDSNLVIEGSGNTFVGGGESASALYNKSYNHKAGENLFLTADTGIYLYANCQEISKSTACCFTTNGNFRLLKNNTGSLGVSEARWTGIYLKNAPYVNSDAKIKKDIQPIKNYKELIRNINPVQYYFTYANSDRLHFGIVSQQFKEAMQISGIDNCGAFCCDVTEEGIKKGYTLDTAPEKYLIYGLRYEELIAPLIAVVQDQDKQLQEMSKTINELKSSVQELQSEVGG